MSLDPFFHQFPGVSHLLEKKLAMPELPVEKLLLARDFELVPGLALAEFQTELWSSPQTLAGLDRRRRRHAYRDLDRRRAHVRFQYPGPRNLQVYSALARHGLSDWVFDLHLKEWWIWKAGTFPCFILTACCHALSIRAKRRVV